MEISLNPNNVRAGMERVEKEANPDEERNVADVMANALGVERTPEFDATIVAESAHCRTMMEDHYRHYVNDKDAAAWTCIGFLQGVIFAMAVRSMQDGDSVQARFAEERKAHLDQERHADTRIAELESTNRGRRHAMNALEDVNAQLTQRNTELEQALHPFAVIANRIDALPHGGPPSPLIVVAEECRAARAALPEFNQNECEREQELREAQIEAEQERREWESE